MIIIIIIMLNGGSMAKEESRIFYNIVLCNEVYIILFTTEWH